MGIFHQVVSDYFETVAVWESWEGGVGLGLIPERDTGDVVLERKVAATASPTEGLDGNPQVVLETNGVHDVPSVHSKALLDLIMSVATDDLR